MSEIPCGIRVMYQNGDGDPKQRGVIADGWLIAIAVLLLAALIVGGITLVKRAFDDADRRGYQRGVSETESRYKTRDNAALAAANKRIQELETKVRAQEQQHVDALARIGKTHQEELDREKAKRARAVADARAGALKLRDPGARPCAAPGGGGEAGEARTAAGSGDAQAGAELSRPFTEFLIDLAGEADEVVRQLGACQAVIEADRRISGGSP